MATINIPKECKTCTNQAEDKTKMPCSRCSLNELYTSHWKAHEVFKAVKTIETEVK